MAYDSILDINEILGEYSKELDDTLYEQSKAIANEGVQELKRTSPVNPNKTSKKGKYRRGWRMDIEKGFGTVEATIYNKTDYQLTHLLEKPHVIRNQYGRWGTSKPKVHIAPVDIQCSKEFEEKVTRKIEAGL